MPVPIPVPPSERGVEAATAAIIGVAVLSLLALLAAGMTFLGRYRRAEATTLQTRVAEAIAADVDCASVDVVTARASSLLPASVTLQGMVPSAAARNRAVRLAQAAARRVEPGVAVIDHLTVEADRAA